MNGSDSIDFRVFVEHALDLFAVASLDGYFTWVNDSWERTLGWTPTELKASPYLEFVHPDDAPSTLAEVSRLRRGENTVEFSNRYRHKQGGYRWIRLTARSKGELVYASARDVTASEEALRASQRELQTLHMAERIGQFGHWHVDMQEAEPKLNWSPNVFRIHGLEPGARVPSLADAVNAYHPDDRATVTAHIETAIAEKRGWDFRLRLVRPSGEVRHVHAVGECELSPDSGEVKALFGVFQDLTDMEATQRARNEELEQFVYRAAHDLQAPLRTIAGFAALVQEELGAEASRTVTKHLQFIEKGTRRMQHLIQELFRFAKAAGDDSQLEPVDMAAIVRGVLETRRPDLDAASAVVTVADLPTVPGRDAVLSSVMLNLIDNALKYRSDDPLRLRIGCVPQRERWHFCVVDNGIGIEASHVERVFKLFERAAPNNADGFGLGLPMCRKVLARLGGKIWVKPAESRGCEVHFTLPRHPTYQARSEEDLGAA